MRFIRSVKYYTILDKITKEVMREKLEISGIQDVKSKYKQNWINHLKEWKTRDCQNTPSNINLEEEVIVDDLRNDGNASLPEQFKIPNIRKKKKKKKIMMMMMK